MRNTITLTDLNDLMEDLDISTYDGDYDEGDYLTTDYSGRGMYGDRCVGIVCWNPAEVMFNLGIAIGERIANEPGMQWADLAESFKRSSQDSGMGLSSIIYFPSLTLDTDPVTPNVEWCDCGCNSNTPCSCAIDCGHAV